MKSCNALHLVLAAVLFSAAARSQTTNVHDVDNGAFSPLKFSGNFSLNAGNSAGVLHFSVPTGKRYVVEFLNITCTPQGANPTAIAEFTIATYDINNPLSAPPSITLTPGHSAAGFYNYASAVKLYADHSGYSNNPSIVITANTETPLSFNHSYYCTAFVSGYTVNLGLVIGGIPLQ